MAQSVETNVSLERAKLINCIINQGLQSAAKLREESIDILTSIDNFPNQCVWGAVIRPQDQFTTHGYYLEQLKGALYTNGNSIFPVLLERPGEYRMLLPNGQLSDQEIETFRERMNVSLLVVCQLAKLRLPADVILPESFYSMVFPTPIWREYQGIVSPEQISHRVHLIDGLIKRPIIHFEPPLEVPDYEGYLERTVQELGGAIWVHAVRLPTEKDLCGPLLSLRGAKRRSNLD